MQPPMYPADAVQPMRDELTLVGFEEVLAPEDVDRIIKETPGTVMVVVNSVCGCAAGAARPGIGMALQHKVIPDRLLTAFAGMEREAVDRVRQLHAGFAPPSSPSIAFFRAGKCEGVMERGHIQGKTPQEVAGMLVGAFDKLCAKPGPSIPPEKFATLEHLKICGSSIPRLNS